VAAVINNLVGLLDIGIVVAEDIAKDADGLGNAIGVLNSSNGTDGATDCKLLGVAVLGIHDG